MSFFYQIKRILALLIVLIFFLSGCESFSGQYEQFIQEQAIESNEILNSQESSQTDESTALIDPRFVPEFNQVEAELKNMDGLTIGATLFASNQSFTQQQDAFEIKIQSFKLFEVEEMNTSFEKNFGYSDEGAAVVLLHTSITNTSNETFYFPIEELKLSYRDAPMTYLPSQSLYPSQSGNLTEILLQNAGEITAGSMVEGYLVYGLNEDALTSINEYENFYLTVVPPRQNMDEIVGLGANILGDELPLFLPLSKQAEEEVSLNQSYIQDRLTTEWWGTKTLLAAEDVQITNTDQDVVYKLERIEVSDFEPIENYADTFQNFTYGQIIVSIQYTVNNQSKHAILPVDGEASLVIGEDEIKSDYALINQLYGQVLQPGESMTVVKSFALDKMRYYDVWQGSDFYIAINTPIDDSYLDGKEDASQTQDGSDEDDILNESVEEFLNGDTAIVIDEGEEEFVDEEEMLELIYVYFNWKPVYLRYINDELDIVEDRADVPNLSDETNEEDEIEE